MATLTLFIKIFLLTINHYHYGTPLEFVEMFSYATNEVICLDAPVNDRKNLLSCHAYCTAQVEWFSLDDIYDDSKLNCEKL